MHRLSFLGNLFPEGRFSFSAGRALGLFTSTRGPLGQMPLRLNFGHTSHLEIGLRQGPHQFIAAVIEPLVRAFGHPRKAVSSEQ